MITKFHRYNESEVNIQLYDRVVCHGSIHTWDENGNYDINIEGQTGIVAYIRDGIRGQCGVVFDNYFFPVLKDLNHIINFRRGLFVPMNQLEQISPPVKNSMKFSDDAENLLNKLEFIKSIESSINYIDVTDKNDTISYISNDRLKRVPDKYIWNSPLRQEMKVGRFIQLINPYTDKRSLDKKIDIYKSAHNNIIGKKSIFKIVEGEEIRKWYDENSYRDGTGMLNKSCMKNKIERLDLYVDNPDKVSLLILVDEDNKLVGRSLIWRVGKPDITYQDRVYTVYQEDNQSFEKFAMEQGWNYYSRDHFNDMIIHLKYNPGRPEENPYMDTFEYFYIKGKYGKYYLSSQYENVGIDDWNTKFYEYSYV